jgi:hypothetical protein
LPAGLKAGSEQNVVVRVSNPVNVQYPDVEFEINGLMTNDVSRKSKPKLLGR